MEQLLQPLLVCLGRNTEQAVVLTTELEGALVANGEADRGLEKWETLSKSTDGNYDSVYQLRLETLALPQAGQGF